MSRRKPIFEVVFCSRNVRRSPRFGERNKTQLRENFKNPNLESASVLRRSPRIAKLTDRNSVEDPKTPNLESVRNQVRRSRARRCVSPHSGGGNGDARIKECVVDVTREEELGKSFGSELRRSPRFGKSCAEQLDGLKLGAVEKKSNAEARTDKGTESVGKERIGLRRSPRFSNQKINYNDGDPKLDSSPDEIGDNDCGNSEQMVKRNRRKSRSPVESEEEWSRMKETGSKNEGKEADAGKRKRKRGKEGSGVIGWTKEQEMALDRAYLAMKPTPHFWKKVSKMVGKSAQECFDRINYDPHTPVPPRRRSRIKRKTSPTASGFSLSASKLLCSPKATRKRKTHLGQKKVRELLQKRCHIEKDYEGDLFSVLEGNIASPLKVSQQTPGVSTPQNESLGKGSSSFSGRIKSISRFGRAAPIISPPVLKQVKNKALHEKYIDQLHCRELKRQAELARAKKTTIRKENLAPSCNQNLNFVKAAKHALESDARDVMFQFQKLQAKAIYSPSETEDDMDPIDNENEDEL